MPFKVLIAEDEHHIRQLIKDYLNHENMNVTEAKNGQEAVDLFLKEPTFDLVILDVMMPIKSGLEACEEIRMVSEEVPILFLTALSTEADEIRGLQLGADDYVTKPFRYELFMTRVRAILRRSTREQKSCWQIGNCLIDNDRREISILGELIELSPKEYDLLLYFVNHVNQALERQQILDAVWGYDYYGDPRTLDTHVKNIRSKMGELGTSIKTVRGFGYRMECEIS